MRLLTLILSISALIVMATATPAVSAGLGTLLAMLGGFGWLMAKLADKAN